MAINCFAMPLAGLPTLCMRFNCASVASGISEKSICESGIGFTFPPACLSCADDADRFFFISRPPYCIDDKKNPACDRLPDPLATRFMRRMFRIVPVQPIGVAEDCDRFLKRDAMFLEVGNGLGNAPHKHICVYTLTCSLVARTEGAPVYRVYLVCLVCLVFPVHLVCLVERD